MIVASSGQIATKLAMIMEEPGERGLRHSPGIAIRSDKEHTRPTRHPSITTRGTQSPEQPRYRTEPSP